MNKLASIHEGINMVKIKKKQWRIQIKGAKKMKQKNFTIFISILYVRESNIYKR